jgi:hypothetical protein
MDIVLSCLNPFWQYAFLLIDVFVSKPRISIFLWKWLFGQRSVTILFAHTRHYVIYLLKRIFKTVFFSFFSKAGKLRYEVLIGQHHYALSGAKAAQSNPVHAIANRLNNLLLCYIHIRNRWRGHCSGCLDKPCIYTSDRRKIRGVSAISETRW